MFINNPDKNVRIEKDRLSKMSSSRSNSVTERKGDSAMLSLAHAYVDFAIENPGYYEAALLKVQDKRTEIVSDQIVCLVTKLLEQLRHKTDNLVRDDFRPFVLNLKQSRFIISGIFNCKINICMS